MGLAGMASCLLISLFTFSVLLRPCASDVCVVGFNDTGRTIGCYSPQNSFTQTYFGESPQQNLGVPHLGALAAAGRRFCYAFAPVNLSFAVSVDGFCFDLVGIGNILRISPPWAGAASRNATNAFALGLIASPEGNSSSFVSAFFGPSGGGLISTEMIHLVDTVPVSLTPNYNVSYPANLTKALSASTLLFRAPITTAVRFFSVNLVSYQDPSGNPFVTVYADVIGDADIPQAGNVGFQGGSEPKAGVSFDNVTLAIAWYIDSAQIFNIRFYNCSAFDLLNPFATGTSSSAFVLGIYDLHFVAGLSICCIPYRSTTAFAVDCFSTNTSAFTPRQNFQIGTAGAVVEYVGSFSFKKATTSYFCAVAQITGSGLTFLCSDISTDLYGDVNIQLGPTQILDYNKTFDLAFSPTASELCVVGISNSTGLFNSNCYRYDSQNVSFTWNQIVNPFLLESIVSNQQISGKIVYAHDGSHVCICRKDIFLSMDCYETANYTLIAKQNLNFAYLSGGTMLAAFVEGPPVSNSFSPSALSPSSTQSPVAVVPSASDCGNSVPIGFQCVNGVLVASAVTISSQTLNISSPSVQVDTLSLLSQSSLVLSSSNVVVNNTLSLDPSSSLVLQQNSSISIQGNLILQGDVTINALQPSSQPPLSVVGCANLSGGLNVSLAQDLAVNQSLNQTIISHTGCINGSFGSIIVSSPSKAPDCYTSQIDCADRALGVLIRLDSRCADLSFSNASFLHSFDFLLVLIYVSGCVLRLALY